MTIADLGTVWVVADIPESSIRLVTLGERIDIELLAYPGESFKARVTQIADVVDSQTRTVRVRAEMSNPGGRFRPEMFGRIRHLENFTQVPVVPVGAVIQGDGHIWFTGKKVQGHSSQWMSKQPTHTETHPILKGLKNGDRVVVDGAMLLKTLRRTFLIAKLLRFALRQRFITIVLGVALVGIGIWSFLQLKIEAYPDISDTQVVVITLLPGRAAEEMEQQVTVPIERALNSVPNVIARRSRTIFGLSVVELTFDYGTNDYFARQVVLEKLRDASCLMGPFPRWARFPPRLANSTDTRWKGKVTTTCGFANCRTGSSFPV